MVHRGSRGIFKRESHHRSLLKTSMAFLIIPRKFLIPYWGLKAAHLLFLWPLSDLIPCHSTSCSPNNAFKWCKQDLNLEPCSNMTSAWLGIPTRCQGKPLCLEVPPHWVMGDSAGMLVKIQIAGPSPKGVCSVDLPWGPGFCFEDLDAHHSLRIPALLN